MPTMTGLHANRRKERQSGYQMVTAKSAPYKLAATKGRLTASGVRHTPRPASTSAPAEREELFTVTVSITKMMQPAPAML